MDIRCQQFTSEEISNDMLDFLGYQHNLYGKTLLENSCGEGNILCLAVERYIQDAFVQGYKSDDIVFGLERDICGAEVVKGTYQKCIENLNHIAENYGLGKVHWNIFWGDILTRPFKIKFDYIVGNPPYISYQNLEEEVREYIKREYSTCRKGKPDYCYAFIENAIQYLAVGGRMVYLIPNSIYKNVYAQNLRNLILQYVEEIRDYSERKLFNKAMTSSAIMLLKNEPYAQKLQYKNISKNKSIAVDKSDLLGKWIFDRISFHQNEVVCFAAFFKASMAIATQRNSIFVIDEHTKRGRNIERGALRPAVSPRNQKYKKKEYIIFPYMVRKHRIINYMEEDFREKYPKAYTYLKDNKTELERRDADKSAKWFEFGRSQALQNMNKPKLLVSTVVTNEVNVYNVSSRAVPYAGIYIISDNGYDLEVARKILKSDSFLRYIKAIGTPASGKSLRITANDINNFKFPLDELER